MPSSLTASDVGEIAKNVRETAEAIFNYRLENTAQLTAAEKKFLADIEERLIQRAEEILTEAVGLVIDEGAASAAELAAVTADIKDTVRQIKSVDQLLKLVGEAVLIAASVASKDISGAGKHLANAAKLMKEIV